MKKYILKQKYFLLGAVLITLVCSFFNVAIIYTIQNLVDSMTTGKIHILQKMGIFLIGLLVANFILNYISDLVEAKISQRLHVDVKKDLFQAILNQRYKEFKKSSIGSKLSVFENDISFIEEYYFNNILVLMRNAIVLVVGIAYLFELNSMMGILLLICTMIVLFIPLILGRNIDPIGEEYSADKGQFINQLKDYFEGMDIIHVYSIERQIQDNYFMFLKKMENKLFQLRKKISLYNQTMITGNYFIVAVSFSIGGILVIKKSISVGELIAITQIMNIIIQPISEVASAIIGIKGSSTVRGKIESVVKNRVEENCYKSGKSESFFTGIECRNISYVSDNDKFSLNNITIKLEPQKKYIIIGSSGCGKTTLLKIIANILDVSLGEIFINGLNYTGNESVVNQVVSLVHQEIFIFNDTVENNIRLYQNYTSDEFDEAIAIAGLKDSLKERIQSKCSEDGSSLSGGEKQRIAIARAILRNTPVFLLDEVTSSLDRITANMILENLFAMQEKTIVFVTHKIETKFLKRADSIICMNEGRIIESGSWDKLIKERGYFYKLYAAGKE